MFVMSAIFFCGSHSNQCYNQYKVDFIYVMLLTLQGISTILVVSGILLYSTSAPAKKHSPDIEEEAALK